MDIIKDLPIPKMQKGPQSKYPFKEMQVGDAIQVYGEGEFVRASAAGKQMGRRMGFNVTCRFDREKDIGTIWRTT